MKLLFTVLALSAATPGTDTCAPLADQQCDTTSLSPSEDQQCTDQTDCVAECKQLCMIDGQCTHYNVWIQMIKHDLIKRCYTFRQCPNFVAKQGVTSHCRNAPDPVVPGGPGTPCPSDCWNYDPSNGSCAVKEGSGCFDLQCTHDKMTLTFQSKMYNVKDDDLNTVFGTENLPTFTTNVGWVKECKLGECGMEAKAVGDNLIFSFSVGKAGGALTLDGSEVQVAPAASSVKYQCSYASTINIATVDKFSVKGATASGETTKTGTLTDGFALKLYIDKAQTKPATADNVIIGYPLYGDMTWSVTSIQSTINFFISECELVDKAAKSVKFIRNNCYSSALGAENLQYEKLVGPSSQFVVIAFIIGKDMQKMEDAEVKCAAKLCLIDDVACKANIKSKKSECDALDSAGNSLAAYNYIANAITTTTTTTTTTPPTTTTIPRPTCTKTEGTAGMTCAAQDMGTSTLTSTTDTPATECANTCQKKNCVFFSVNITTKTCVLFPTCDTLKVDADYTRYCYHG